MRCPYCAAPLQEDSPECPGCRLDLRRAAQLLGPVPRTEPGLCDSTSALSATERKRIRKRIDELARRFPQVRPQLVFRHFSDGHPIGLHAFWIFNLAAFSSDAENHGQNHGVLLLVDPVAGESAITPGYGLEPFLTHDELDDLLGMAESGWNDKDWCGGTLTLLDGLEGLLERAASRAADALDRSPREAPSGPSQSVTRRR